MGSVALWGHRGKGAAVWERTKGPRQPVRLASAEVLQAAERDIGDERLIDWLLPARPAPRSDLQPCLCLTGMPSWFVAAVTYSKPRLATFWHYAKVELIPPTPAEIPTAIQSFKKIVRSAQTGSFKQLTVKEALLNGLVATEVWMWFYVGEIIGKRSIIGYNV
uniref:ATP synthase membrane subunit g n=1 Tax=Myotis myotis TaxID=51298 RepID=A0A7J7VFW2_MYOMY|nr:ATP synthase membrane subunit g [Myotis myotis]